MALLGTGFGSGRLQKQRNLELYRDITDDVEESDFVPYACLYNPDTLITKNGELCQTIKITGFTRETVGIDHDPEELRTLIRDSLKRHVPNDSFAIWLHTIRKDSNVSPEGAFDNNFADRLNHHWIDSNSFENQFVNEVFVTIVHEGQSAKILSTKNFTRGLIPSRDLKWRNKYIDSIHEVLNNTVDNILDDLQHYGAKRLGMYKQNGVYYSEQLEFLEKLINFVDRPMPIVEMDLCTYLTTGEITFAYNSMEVRTALGKRRFASILTLKEYKEASLSVIDNFLQLPMEFIVTQCVNFVNPQKVRFEYQELANYQRLSEDPDISRLSELSQILDSNRNSPNDFGEQQLTIFILSDTLKLLEDNLRKTIRYFSKYGMVAVREDIKFEETYWAQLPGNFVFVSRTRSANTSHVGGFANLNNMPVGKETDNHWGDAVTTFHTASGTPYYFNFHEKHVGHSLIVGPDGSGKSVIAHFLLAQCMKYNPNIYYFDVSGKSAYLMEAIGGKVIDIQPLSGEESSHTPALFNPLSLKNTPQNQQYISRWMTVLARTMGYNPTQQDKDAIAKAVSMIYTQPASHRHLAACINMLQHDAPSYVHHMTNWLPGGHYGHIFTATDDGALSHAAILSFQLNDMVQDMALQASVPSMLLQLLTDRLEDNPTIFAMEEGWRLLSQTHLAADIGAWMDTLTEHNAMMLMLAQDIEGCGEIPLTKQLVDKTTTRIYMPDEEPCEEYTTVFGLDRIEYSYLELMERSERHFLVKHAGDAVVGEMNLRGLDEYLEVLAGDTPHTSLNFS